MALAAWLKWGDLEKTNCMVVVDSGEKQCLSVQITVMKEIQGLLCQSVKLFEDLLHISWKSVCAFHLCRFLVKNTKEIILWFLYEK